MRLNQVTVGCLDYGASVKFYQMLGLVQIVDAPPRYARFETDSGETFSIQKVDQIFEPTGMIYFETDTLDADVAALEAKGIIFNAPPTDQNWGWREARLHDPAGNALCLFHGGDNRRFPPWRISNSKEEKDMKNDKCKAGTCKHDREQPTAVRRPDARPFWMAYPVGGAINVGWPHDPHRDG
ncbi:VOC family protein [Parasphingorhabdus cellanae]|uniref:VOC family protein n=1 Tax=Parasphingorhabdus cellanae TaxID=2806553 RepID=UPI001FB11A60|nr:VOC family protein [Parasphingorhabdus cellanae]